MHTMPDLWALERIARQLDDQADDLRRQARRLATAIEMTRWKSSAAGAFREHGHRLCLELRRCASRVDDAATALRSHSRTVRNRVAGLLAGAEALEHAARAARTIGSDAVGEGARVAGRAAVTVASAAERGLATIGLP
jgi:hypothetical protein